LHFEEDIFDQPKDTLQVSGKYKLQYQITAALKYEEIGKKKSITRFRQSPMGDTATVIVAVVKCKAVFQCARGIARE